MSHPCPDGNPNLHPCHCHKTPLENMQVNPLSPNDPYGFGVDHFHKPSSDKHPDGSIGNQGIRVEGKRVGSLEYFFSEKGELTIGLSNKNGSIAQRECEKCLMSLGWGPADLSDHADKDCLRHFLEASGTVVNDNFKCIRCELYLRDGQNWDRHRSKEDCDRWKAHLSWLDHGRCRHCTTSLGWGPRSGPKEKHSRDDCRYAQELLREFRRNDPGIVNIDDGAEPPTNARLPQPEESARWLVKDSDLGQHPNHVAHVLFGQFPSLSVEDVAKLLVTKYPHLDESEIVNIVAREREARRFYPADL